MLFGFAVFASMPAFNSFCHTKFLYIPAASQFLVVFVLVIGSVELDQFNIPQKCSPHLVILFLFSVSIFKDFSSPDSFLFHHWPSFDRQFLTPFGLHLFHFSALEAFYSRSNFYVVSSTLSLLHFISFYVSYDVNCLLTSTLNFLLISSLHFIYYISDMLLFALFYITYPDQIASAPLITLFSVTSDL